MRPFYETRSFSCTKEAIAWLGKEPFNILLTNFRMPGMDGLGMIEKARNIAPMVIKILVTGVLPEELGDWLKKSRVNKFLSKPLDWHEPSLLLRSLG